MFDVPQILEPVMANASFERRLARIEHSRKDRSVGSGCLIESDGLVIQFRQERAAMRRPAWHGLVAVVVTVLALKASLVTLVAEPIYEERLAAFESASPVGQAVAWTMQPGPLTDLLAQRLRSLIS